MVGSSIEYKKLGLFTFERPEINDGQNRYKGYDRMMYKFNMLYSTALTGAHKTSEYMAEIARRTGVPFVSALEDITITMLPGYTYREVIGYIAALHGANAIINDEGNLEFRCEVREIGSLFYEEADFIFCRHHVLQGICGFEEAFFPVAAVGDEGLLDVAFGIEWFFLKAGGEGSDTTH